MLGKDDTAETYDFTYFFSLPSDPMLFSTSFHLTNQTQVSQRQPTRLRFYLLQLAFSKRWKKTFGGNRSIMYYLCKTLQVSVHMVQLNLNLTVARVCTNGEGILPGTERNGINWDARYFTSIQYNIITSLIPVFCK